MPSIKRQVLACLDKRTLVDICQAFGYKGMSVRMKATHYGTEKVRTLLIPLVKLR